MFFHICEFYFFLQQNACFYTPQIESGVQSFSDSSCDVPSLRMIFYVVPPLLVLCNKKVDEKISLFQGFEMLFVTFDSRIPVSPPVFVTFDC